MHFFTSENIFEKIIWREEDLMIRDERISRMGTYISAQQYVSMDELVSRFHVSKATVRRDLEILNQQGVICLLRGGARKKDCVEQELMYAEKLGRNREEKVRICQYASTLIQEEQTIFLDTGVTAREMVPYLCEMRNIHVVTNDVWIAAHIVQNMDIKVSMPGGNIRRGYYTMKGSETEQYMSNLYVDIAFISIDAVDSDFGCSITNNDEVLIKHQMIAHSQNTVIIADHSKFETVASWRVCPLEDIDLFITGKELKKDTAECYEKLNVHVKTV